MDLNEKYEKMMFLMLFLTFLPHDRIDVFCL